jgi:hypothetical protein
MRLDLIKYLKIGKFFLLCFISSTIPSFSTPFMAFDYSYPKKEDLLFLSNFKYVVTNSYWKEKDVEFLKSHGVKLLKYEWLPAFYFCGKVQNSWHREIMSNLKNWVIDYRPNDRDPMGKRYGCKDYFFTFNTEFIKKRVFFLVKDIKNHNYDGVFFDWASGSKIFQEEEYKFLHEELEKRGISVKDYDSRIATFLKLLKEKGLIIALNRGFRSPKGLFDRWADIDVVESVFTTDTKDGTRFVNPAEALNTAFTIIKKLKPINPHIHVVFLNYVSNSNKKTVDEAIVYGICLSLLSNSFSFSVSENVDLSGVKKNWYSVDLGKPYGKYEKVKGKEIWLRKFSKGMVIVGRCGTKLKIKLNGCLLSLVDGKFFCSGGNRNSIVIPLGSKCRTPFIGRIFLYN